MHEISVTSLAQFDDARSHASLKRRYMSRISKKNGWWDASRVCCACETQPHAPRSRPVFDVVSDLLVESEWDREEGEMRYNDTNASTCPLDGSW